MPSTSSRGSREREDHDPRGSGAGATRRGGRRRAIGTGYDLHRLVDGRPLVLGGVTIPADGRDRTFGRRRGVPRRHRRHARRGRRRRHRPAISRHRRAMEGRVEHRAVARLGPSRARGGFAVENVDVTVVLERPKIAPLVAAIQARRGRGARRGRRRASASRARPTKASTRSAAAKRSRRTPSRCCGELTREWDSPGDW